MCALCSGRMRLRPHLVTMLLGQLIVGWSTFSPLLTSIDITPRRSMAAASAWVTPIAPGLYLPAAVAVRSLWHRCCSLRSLDVFEDGHAGYASDGAVARLSAAGKPSRRRTAGWEHFVPSPNVVAGLVLERHRGFLAEVSGASLDIKDLRRRASLIQRAVQQELWDDQVGWFRCRYPDGHLQPSYSVQAFDAVRAGCCSSEMVTALGVDIRYGAFLGNYGVSSVSEDGVHYEVGDPDWSGPRLRG